MRRILVRAAGGLESMIVETNAPIPRNSHQVRVRVEYAGQTDRMIREGKYAGGQPSFPLTLGYDAVGRIDDIGSKVDTSKLHYKPGSRVAVLAVTGCQADYVCVDPDRVFPIPEEIDGAKAVALVLSYMTAYQLLTRCAHVKSGERILIHGASGGAGTAVVQLGHLMGLKVYGTCSAAKMDHVRKLGGIPIDYKNQDFVDVITTKLEDGPGVDAVFDPIGGEHFKRSYKCLRDGGRFVAFGMQTMANGESTSLMSSLANYAMIKMWPFDHHGPSSLYSIDDMRKSHPERFAEDLSHLCNLVLRKELDPVVSAVLPLEQAVEAMRMIDDGRVIGKVVLKVH